MLINLKVNPSLPVLIADVIIKVVKVKERVVLPLGSHVKRQFHHKKTGTI